MPWLCPVAYCSTVIDFPDSTEPSQTRSVLEHLYHRHLWSTTKISREFHTSEGALYYRMKRMGVWLRGREQAGQVRFLLSPHSILSRQRMSESHQGLRHRPEVREQIALSMQRHFRQRELGLA
jgi:hypothetical protein